MGKVSAFDMNALDSRIRELVAYARERDGEDRTALFRNLVDLFLTGKAPTRQPTRDQLLDVIEALLPHVDTDSRRTAADLVACMSEPPLDLALRLARDRAGIATELLKKMPFDEDAFIELIGATGREHHQILASRADLSANVWIALARAAPAAPPFDSRSTLALWRDDLGAQGDRTGATVTMLHAGNDTGPNEPEPGKAASLRILRTGEDLVADRAQKAPDLPETLVHDNDDPTAEAAPEPAPAPVETTPEPRDRLRDPGPGGWSWRSDRDGFVTDVSPHGRKLLDGTVLAVGANVLDLLGLNAKLGHPVSRAFQRRSAIHDAPISLEPLARSHRYWTLDAAPLFSPCGGVFEGYEGALTPVVAAQESETPVDEDYDDDPLFLDDLDERNRPAPASFASKPTVLASAETMVENRAREAVQAAVDDMIQTVAPATVAPPETVAAATPERLDVPAHQAEILGTLDLLEEALNRLGEGSRKSGNMQLRLQAEIAAACARSLREQLGE